MNYQKDHEKIREYAKALRQCQNSTTRGDCVGCPYYDDDACDSVSMDVAADVIEALLREKGHEQKRWVPVTERKPEDGESVLIYCVTEGIRWQVVGYYWESEGLWYSDEGEHLSDVQAWRELPEYPAEDGEAEQEPETEGTEAAPGAELAERLRKAAEDVRLGVVGPGVRALLLEAAEAVQGRKEA